MLGSLTCAACSSEFRRANSRANSATSPVGEGLRACLPSLARGSPPQWSHRATPDDNTQIGLSEEDPRGQVSRSFRGAVWRPPSPSVSPRASSIATAPPRRTRSLERSLESGACCPIGGVAGSQRGDDEARAAHGRFRVFNAVAGRSPSPRSRRCYRGRHRENTGA